MQLGRAGLGYYGGSRRKNPYKRIPPNLAAVFLPKSGSTDSKNLMKKVPPHMLNILMPKVDTPNTSVDEKILIFSTKEKTKKEKFL